MEGVPTIRVATEADLPEVRRLLALPDGCDLAGGQTASHARRYVLVVDAEEKGLCAVAMVALTAPQARLEALAVDTSCRGPELEARMIGVAHALAEAFGCAGLEVPGQVAA